MATPDKKLDYEAIGQRVRQRRKQFGLSTEQLAAKASVARYTIVRIESGLPCTNRTLQKVRGALRLFTDQLMRPRPDSPDYIVSRGTDYAWSVSKPKANYQTRQVDEDPLHVNDAVERKRLGGLGFQPFFTAILESELPGGVMSQALMELHKPSWVDSHYGEEFVYCLRGPVRITVNEAPCILESGDSMCFDAKLPHQYEPAVPLGPKDEPCLILLVVAHKKGEKRRP